MLGVPLRKGDDGFDVQPILIGEFLFALPGAYLQVPTKIKASKILAKTQFGIGVGAGPEILVALSNALSKLCPEDILTALDLRNVLGRYLVLKSLQTFLMFCPKLLHLLFFSWGIDGSPISIPTSASS